jgi:phosphotriesterase-related protein
MTARGLKRFDPAAGYTLPHEHILVDIRAWWTGDGDWRVLDPPDVDMQTALDEILRAPEEVCRENMVICDWYVAGKELRLARESGCQLLVDLTTTGLGPQPSLALQAADLGGLDLVLGVGRYLSATLTTEERDLSVDELTDRWLKTCAEGWDGLRPGIIGEIGTSQVIDSAEMNSLRAAARVQADTGLAINVHVHPYARQALVALDVLAAEGADLSRVAISHCDGELDLGWLLTVLERGCYIGFDQFGTTPEQLYEKRAYPGDHDRLAMIRELVDRGWAERILLSQDVCHRTQLAAYAGPGYGHVATSMAPLLDELIGERTTAQLMAENPLRLMHLDEREQ